MYGDAAPLIVILVIIILLLAVGWILDANRLSCTAKHVRIVVNDMNIFSGAAELRNGAVRGSFGTINFNPDSVAIEIRIVRNDITD